MVQITDKDRFANGVPLTVAEQPQVQVGASNVDAR